MARGISLLLFFNFSFIHSVIYFMFFGQLIISQQLSYKMFVANIFVQSYLISQRVTDRSAV